MPAQQLYIHIYARVDRDFPEKEPVYIMRVSVGFKAYKILPGLMPVLDAKASIARACVVVLGHCQRYIVTGRYAEFCVALD